MEVECAYCASCGMEWLDPIFLPHVDRYLHGDFVRCPECDGSIGPGSYDVAAEPPEDN